jgi:16S rRNA (guanine527-N7)-methyltransferase
VHENKYQRKTSGSSQNGITDQENAIMKNQRAELLNGFSALNITASEEQLARLLTFLAELDRWNQRFGFIKADIDELISLHLLDALAGLSLLKSVLPSGTVLDFGSGAGFPGLPLAFFLPAHRFVLCERKAKENAFLSNASALLGLNNVIVINDIAMQGKGSLDAVVFRAVTSLADIYPIVKPYLAPGGILFAYKGKREKIDEEIAGLAGLDVRSEVYELVVPGGERERHIVVVRTG